MKKLDVSIGAEALYQHLKQDSAEIDGWYISLDDDGIWITNPYGQDCGLYESSVADSQLILDRIANDAHDQEWN